jgi:hypothetical protein
MSNPIIRLYAFQPKGHGERSFFVAAASEDEAKCAVEKHLTRVSEYEKRGWGTDYYEMTVLDVGQVVSNTND